MKHTIIDLLFGKSEEQQIPLKQGNLSFYPSIWTMVIQDEMFLKVL